MAQNPITINIAVIDDTSGLCAAIQQKLSVNAAFGINVISSDASSALNTAPDIIVFDLSVYQKNNTQPGNKITELIGGLSSGHAALSGILDEGISKAMLELGISFHIYSAADFVRLAQHILSVNPKQEVIPASLHEQELERQITAFIREIGIPPHIKGYHYIRTAILLSTQSPQSINGVTKVLYPAIAEIYDTSSARVERAIRNAIEIAWSRMDTDVLNRIFGCPVHKYRPTNAEFIALISDYLRLEGRRGECTS